MSKVVIDWRSFCTENGDFELPRYLYLLLINLMKQTLDLGTLLSSDSAKLRAYKETVKHTFKAQWFDLAQALESFGIIVPCGCQPQNYCSFCSGARYRLNPTLTPDRMREISVVLGAENASETAEKLQQGLAKAMREVG